MFQPPRFVGDIFHNYPRIIGRVPNATELNRPLVVEHNAQHVRANLHWCVVMKTLMPYPFGSGTGTRATIFLPRIDRTTASDRSRSCSRPTVAHLSPLFR